MTEYIIIVAFIFWYVLSLVISEKLGKMKKIGTEWSFLICMIFSPVIGYLVTRYSADK